MANSKAGFLGYSSIVALMVCLFVIPSGCEDLLSVDVPTDVEENDLMQPENSELLVNSVVAQFECALGHPIVAGGLMGFELKDSQLSASLWDYDRRTPDPSDNGALYAVGTCDSFLGLYTTLSKSASLSKKVLSRLQEWSKDDVPDKSNKLATVAAYSGYSITHLGEAMCSAALYQEEELSRSGLFQKAIENFSLAISNAREANNDEILNMALVGRARAHLNLDQLEDAAADARKVSDKFVKYATYSGVSERRENKIYTMNIRGEDVTIFKDFRNLQYKGVDDPRVSVQDGGVDGDDNVTPMWFQQKYESVDSSVPIATKEEAKLILAEVEIRGNDNAEEAVNIINEFHDEAGLPDYEGGSNEEIMSHIVQERQRELFLEGHHLGDINRYDLDLRPEPGAPYPPKAGGVYGDNSCFPIPNVEVENNPNI